MIVKINNKNKHVNINDAINFLNENEKYVVGGKNPLITFTRDNKSNRLFITSICGIRFNTSQSDQQIAREEVKSLYEEVVNKVLNRGVRR